MNTATICMHASSGVRLNPLYSMSGAVLGTALMCALLLLAFTHPLPSIPVQILRLSLVAIPNPALKRVSQSIPHTPTVKAVTQPIAAKPIVIPQTSTVKPAQSPATLDLSLPGMTLTLPPASAFVPHAFNPYSDLSRQLNAPAPRPTLRNGDAYRSIYGFTEAKMGGRCLELHTIQMGPSPSVRATVGYGMPCSGNPRPTMADELKAWADKQAAKNPEGP